MKKIGKQKNYIKFLRCAMKDPDIAEKFQCIAKTEMADCLQKKSHAQKDDREALNLFREVIKSQGSRYIDRQFSKQNYRKLFGDLRGGGHCEVPRIFRGCFL